MYTAFKNTLETFLGLSMKQGPKINFFALCKIAFKFFSAKVGLYLYENHTEDSFVTEMDVNLEVGGAYSVVFKSASNQSPNYYVVFYSAIF